ncbi:toll/interleukin-1 receptor domain-containing protein, partial [Escherichia coli]
MFNLLMSGMENTWDAPTWVLPNDRYLEYTHPDIKAEFGSLNDQVVTRLKSFPALFCYERYIDSPAKVGQITEIERRTRELKITYSINHDIPFITQKQLFDIFPYLGVEPDTFELTRTHWALKDVNLINVLRTKKIIQRQLLQSQRRPPKVFITYSWDSPEHKQWVAQLAGCLRNNGIDAFLDQWNIRGGEDMSVFMERSIREADRVLVICTDRYCYKARGRVGGVGYESHLLTSEIMQEMGTIKFIPIIRNLTNGVSLPDALSGRFYYNLSDGAEYHNNFECSCPLISRQGLYLKLTLPADVD